MGRIVTLHGAMSTSLVEVFECIYPGGMRLLAFQAANTNAANRTVRLVLDRDGSQTDIIPSETAYPSIPYDHPPSFFFLTKAEQNSEGRLVGDKLFVQASGTGVDYHISLEVLDQ